MEGASWGFSPAVPLILSLSTYCVQDPAQSGANCTGLPHQKDNLWSALPGQASGEPAGKAARADLRYFPPQTSTTGSSHIVPSME